MVVDGPSKQECLIGSGHIKQARWAISYSEPDHVYIQLANTNKILAQGTLKHGSHKLKVANTVDEIMPGQVAFVDFKFLRCPDIKTNFEKEPGIILNHENTGLSIDIAVIAQPENTILKVPVKNIGSSPISLLQNAVIADYTTIDRDDLVHLSPTMANMQSLDPHLLLQCPCHSPNRIILCDKNQFSNLGPHLQPSPNVTKFCNNTLFLDNVSQQLFLVPDSSTGFKDMNVQEFVNLLKQAKPAVVNDTEINAV
jgi:hypothetical protein